MPASLHNGTISIPKWHGKGMFLSAIQLCNACHTSEVILCTNNWDTYYWRDNHSCTSKQLSIRIVSHNASYCDRLNWFWFSFLCNWNLRVFRDTRSTAVEQLVWNTVATSAERPADSNSHWWSYCLLVSSSVTPHSTLRFLSSSVYAHTARPRLSLLLRRIRLR